MTKKYDSYKPSGIEWLGEIPNHWNVVKLLNISNKVDYRGKTPAKTSSGIFLVTARNIKNGKINYSLSKEYISKDDFDNVMNRGKVSIGDILFTTEAPLGEVALVDKEDIALAQRIIKFQFKNEVTYSLYIKYLMASSIFQNQIYSQATGSTALGLKGSKLNGLKVFDFSIKEQQLIANYLDEKTSSIDSSIETLKSQKERLIEQKKAIIHKAVTKGLDDSVEMKDSGVEWIGDIPKHWKIEHLKNLINYKTGNTPDSKKSSYYGNENDYPWANISDLNNKNIYTTKKTLTKEGVIAKNLNVVKENSLLFSFKLSVGNCSFNRIQLYTNEAIASFEENKKISLNWLYYFMSYFFINNSKENIYGAPILNRDLIENGNILKISKIEQELIANYLDEKTSKIEEAVNEVEKQINLLEEYKKTLINEVVTGKIKVF